MSSGKMPAISGRQKSRPQPRKRKPATNTVRRFLPALLLIVIIGLTVYANTFNAPFEFDDNSNILNNPFIRVTHITVDALVGVLKSPSITRPLANLTFALNYYFHQYDVTGYHIVNVVIHLITAFLVFLITRQTLVLCRSGRVWIALPAALIWMVNPLHTQSVTYIVQRMNALAVMFYLLAMACYIQGRLIQRQKDGSGRRPLLFFIAAATAFILGLVSKEITVTLPVMVFLYEWFFFRGLDKQWFRKQTGRIIVPAVVLMIVALIYLKGNPLVKSAFSYKGKDFTLAQRLLTEPGVVLYYLSLLFYPSPERLRIIYDFPVVTSLFSVPALLPLFSLACLVAAALLSRHRNRLASFAIIWFLVNLVIESSILPLWLVFEHRTYLPSVFPFIALTGLLFDNVNVKTALTAICGAIILCGFWTWQRNAVWKDNITFWTDAVKKSPLNARAHHNLGVAYDVLHRIEDAERQYRRSLELDPEFEKAHCSLGIILMYRGLNESARKHFKQVLAINPRDGKALNYLGIACFRKGEADQAITYFKKALAINPYYAEAAANLEMAVQNLQQYGQAIAGLLQEHHRHPDDPEIAYQLAAACQQARMEDRAVDLYRQVLVLNPKCEKCMDALVRIFIFDTRFDRAAQMLERLLLTHPDNPELFYSLACAYARDNRKEKAVAALEKAVGKGFSDIDYIRADKNLEAIRDTDYFRRLTTDR